MWTNQDVSNLLRQYRQMLANVKLIESQILYSGMCSLTESEMKLYVLYRSGLDLIQTWLTLLDKGEQFVVKLHLIDKMDWAKVSIEYEKLWTRENGRAERTFKRIQSNAVSKIVKFMQFYPLQNPEDFYPLSFLAEEDASNE